MPNPTDRDRIRTALYQAFRQGELNGNRLGLSVTIELGGLDDVVEHLADRLHAADRRQIERGERGVMRRGVMTLRMRVADHAT